MVRGNDHAVDAQPARTWSWRREGEPVLTIRQPWASMTMEGVKTLEYRDWVTDYRGRLWIHVASRRSDASAAADLPRGVILGSVELVSIGRSRQPWYGRHAWKLVNPRLLPEPIPAKGRLWLWPLPDDVLTRIRVQLGELGVGALLARRPPT